MEVLATCQPRWFPALSAACEPAAATPRTVRRGARFFAPRMSAAKAAERALDVQLLARTAAGEEAAFAALYDRFAPGLFSMIVKMTHDEKEAEDVLQEGFAHIWRRAATYDAARSSPFTWAVMILRNKAIDRLRERQRIERTLEKATVEFAMLPRKLPRRGRRASRARIPRRDPVAPRPSCGLPQNIAQLQQPAADARLDGAQRRRQLRGDLLVRQPAEKRQFHGALLLLGKLRQRRPHLRAVIAPPGLAGRHLIGLGKMRKLDGRFFDRAREPLPHAQPVDGLVAQDHHRPGKRAAARRIVGRRTPPDVGETFLQNILSLLFVVRHFHNHGEKAGRETVVERGESGLVSRRRAEEQVRVEFAIGARRAHTWKCPSRAGDGGASSRGFGFTGGGKC